jgi:hypothetical protein
MCEISLARKLERTLDLGDVSFRFIASLINRLLNILGEFSKKIAMTQRSKVVADVLPRKSLSTRLCRIQSLPREIRKSTGRQAAKRLTTRTAQFNLAALRRTRLIFSLGLNERNEFAV